MKLLDSSNSFFDVYCPAEEAKSLIRIVAEEVHAMAAHRGEILVSMPDGQYAPDQFELPYHNAFGGIAIRERLTHGSMISSYCRFLQSNNDEWFFGFGDDGARGLILRIEERIASPPRQYIPFKSFPKSLRWLPENRRAGPDLVCLTYVR